MHRRALGALALAAATLAAASSASAGTIRVTTAADQDGQDHAKCGLREAIHATNADHDFGGCNDSGGADVVKLGSAHYVLSRGGADEDKDATGDLDVTADLRIAGRGMRKSAIDGRHAHDRVLEVHPSADVKLDSLTVKKGHEPDAGGGGIFNGGTLVLSHSSVRGNSGLSEGGGIANIGTLTLKRSVVSGNSDGGLSSLDGQLSISGSTVSGNSNTDTGGGGVRAFDSNTTIENSTIKGNTAVESGGGVLVFDGNATIEDSTISGNTARGSDGGGLLIEIADATIENSTISGNKADGDGGGLRVSESTGTLTTLNNVTVARNTADADSADGGDGGGLSQTGGSMLAYNTILADNTAPTSNDCATTGLGANYDLIEDDAGCNGIGANNVIGADPMLEGLAKNGGKTKSHALGPLSPAINAANPAAPESEDGACLSKDQRGHDRPDGSRCDIGAFERHLTP